MVQHVLFPELTGLFLIFLWPKHVISIYSTVSDNLGERSIPSDHVAVRVVAQKPTTRCDQVKRFPSWMSKHPIFFEIFSNRSAKTIGTEPFAALADFKLIIEKARKQTHQELLRNTPGSLGAKFLISSTTLQAYRKRTFRHTDALLCIFMD